MTSRWASHFYALSAHPGANTGRHGQVRGRELGQILADVEHERACPIDAGFARQGRVGQVGRVPARNIGHGLGDGRRVMPAPAARGEDHRE